MGLTQQQRSDIAEGHPPRIDALGWCRLGARAGLLALALLLCVPLHYLWRLVRIGSPWPRIYLGWAARFAGARATRIGVPLKRDVFYISNHLSWIDILAIAGASGSAFVAKAELARTPVIGWLARINRTVFVSREDRMGVAEQINQLRDALADNWSVTVFPEGTTTDGRSLLPFKTPMLRVLEPPPPGVLVQPVMLDYGAMADEVAWIGVESGIDNARRLLARRGSFPLKVHFLEPFDPRDFPGRKAIAAESRRRIEEALVATLGAPLRPFRYDVAPVRYTARSSAASLPELDQGEKARRAPVWSALADLFLDTDVSLLREADARTLAASPYGIDQIERILLDEVTPAVAWNLRQIAGEWAAFDHLWLAERIVATRVAPGHGKRLERMWDDWLALRDATVRLREGPSLAMAPGSR